MNIQSILRCGMNIHAVILFGMSTMPAVAQDGLAWAFERMGLSGEMALRDL